MKIYIGFIVAASKMFFRRKSSIFWTLFFPVVIMLALGNFSFGAYSAPNVGLVNNSTNQLANNLSNTLSQATTIVVKINPGEESIFSRPYQNFPNDVESSNKESFLTASQKVLQKLY